MSTPLPVPDKNWPNTGTHEIADFDNTPGEVLQEQEYDPAKVPPIPVVICEPARTVTLPSKSGGWRQYDLTVGTSQRVLDRDPRRRRAIIQVSDAAGASAGALLGGSEAEGTSDYAFLLATTSSGNTTFDTATSYLLEVTSMDEVWASASGASCVLSVMNEQWAL